MEQLKQTKKQKRRSPRVARQSWGMSILCHPLLKVLKLPTDKLAPPPSTALWWDQPQKPESCRSQVLSSPMSVVSSGARGQCHTGGESIAALRKYFNTCCQGSELVMIHSGLNKVERCCLTPWRVRWMPAGAASMQEHKYGLWLKYYHGWSVKHFPGCLPLEIWIAAALRNRYFSFCTRQIPTLKWETLTKFYSQYC